MRDHPPSQTPSGIDVMQGNLFEEPVTRTARIAAASRAPSERRLHTVVDANEAYAKSFPVAPARNTDPETAHKAASEKGGERGKQRLDVLAHLRRVGERGSSDYQTGKALGILRTSAGKRRKELCEMNLVLDSGTRRPTDTGSTAIVWVCAEFAVAK